MVWFFHVKYTKDLENYLWAHEYTSFSVNFHSPKLTFVLSYELERVQIATKLDKEIDVFPRLGSGAALSGPMLAGLQDGWE